MQIEIRVNAMAVVGDGEHHCAAVIFERNVDVLCAGMLGDIGQRLLEDAKQRCGELRVERDILARADEIAGDAHALPELLDLPFDRGRHAIVEYQRAQAARYAARCFDRRIQQRLHRVCFFRQRGLLRLEAGAYPGQVYLRRRQRAAEIIVDFPGDMAAFLFLDMLDVRGQLPQLQLLGFGCVLGQFALGDIRDNAVRDHHSGRHLAHTRAQIHPFDFLAIGPYADASFPVARG